MFKNQYLNELMERVVKRNPNEPENEVVIPERTVVKFRAGKELKDAVEKLNPADFK